MIANYHTHTWRCNHASGVEKEYVTRAIERGLNTLGFSDHTPYFFPGDYYSTFRMHPEQLSDYIQTIQNLQNSYSSQIQIPIGLEAEYYPEYFSDLLSFLRDYPIDYMILGQHFVGNELNAQYSGRPFDDASVLKKYCHQIMDAIQTGLFTYIAHPDIIRFTGEISVYRACMSEMIQEAKSCAIPLEINLLGISEGRHYPNRLFWEEVATENCPVVLGLDAHSPDAITRTAHEKMALEIVNEFGLTLLNTVNLRSIR